MDKTIEDKNVSSMRVKNYLLFSLCGIAGSIFLCLKYKILIDEILAVMALNIMFYAICAVVLYCKRTEGVLHGNTSTNYKNLIYAAEVSWGLLCLFSYLPESFAPMMIIAFIIASVLDETAAICIGIFWNILFGYLCGYSMYTSYCYIIMMIVAVLLSSFLLRQEEILTINIILLSVCMILPTIFYYLTYLQINKKIFLYGLGSSLCTCFFSLVFFSKLVRPIVEDETMKYDKIIDSEYPLVKDIQKYSMAEYRHALKVSKLSYLCAQEIQVNEKAAACGGFYYRLGKMEGEPEIDNAVKLAENHCFPYDVISILREYNGILHMPSTPESAIVHMVDQLVIKIDALGANTMASSWNQDMVIYQTLNELSQKGMYDQSGLTMNQFLKVREILVKEDFEI